MSLLLVSPWLILYVALAACCTIVNAVGENDRTALFALIVNSPIGGLSHAARIVFFAFCSSNVYCATVTLLWLG
jgi:hypothetical protein